MNTHKVVERITKVMHKNITILKTYFICIIVFFFPGSSVNCLCALVPCIDFFIQ